MRFDNSAFFRKSIWVLYAVCAILAFADLIIHRKAIFSVEAWPGFYAWFGLIAGGLLVFISQLLRKLVMRDETYYD